MNMNAPDRLLFPDIQSQIDRRDIAIDSVGACAMAADQGRRGAAAGGAA
jgi:hypothetical protein